MTKPRQRQLSPKEAKFCEAVGRGLSGTDACLEAGYSDNPRTRSVTASRLRKKAHIQARIAEIIQPTQPLDEREKHIRRLESMRDECRAAKSYAAAVRCEELISKARNLTPDTLDLSVHQPIDQASSPQLIAALSDIFSRHAGLADMFKQPAPPAADDDEPKPAAGEAVH
jgi:hypothetical protein